MRLLMTADTVGGVWTYAMELCRVLAASGTEIRLATMGGPVRPEQRSEAEIIPGLSIAEGDFKLEWMQDPWEDVRRAGAWLLSLEEEFRPDIVHLNDYSHGALPWRAPVLMVGHSCVLSWWDAVRRERVPEEWRRYQREVARGLGAADLVAAPTRAMLAALQKHYGPFRHTKVLPNGRDAGLLRPAAKEPFIFSAGRLWDEAKNVAALGQVAPSLPWPVVVAGECRHPSGGDLQPENVRCLGRIGSGEVADWLGRASIYALPARYEPFGLSALEAAFSGCALVLGDIPSLREVWGDAALWVSPDDPEALRDALLRLIKDETERSALAERARVRAFEFTPERMGAAYSAAYRWLLETAGTPAVSPGDRVLGEREEAAACVS